LAYLDQAFVALLDRLSRVRPDLHSATAQLRVVGTVAMFTLITVAPFLLSNGLSAQQLRTNEVFISCVFFIIEFEMLSSAAMLGAALPTYIALA
jgi:hypothetical protein